MAQEEQSGASPCRAPGVNGPRRYLVPNASSATRALRSASSRLAYLLGYGATDAALLPRAFFYRLVRDVLVFVVVEGQHGVPRLSAHLPSFLPSFLGALRMSVCSEC